MCSVTDSFRVIQGNYFISFIGSSSQSYIDHLLFNLVTVAGWPGEQGMQMTGAAAQKGAASSTPTNTKKHNIYIFIIKFYEYHYFLFIFYLWSNNEIIFIWTWGKI